MENCYFSHDSNASNDPKIMSMRSVYGWEGYGWYWLIVEMLREQKEYKLKLNKYIYNALAMQMHCNAEKSQSYIEDCINEFYLFESDGEYLWANSLIKRMGKMEEKSSKAKKAAEARWNKTKENEHIYASALQTHCDSNTNKIKENKIKEIIKEEEENLLDESRDEESDELELKFDHDSIEYRLSDYLRKHILKNYPNTKVPETLNKMQTWAVHIDRMIRLDNREVEDIRAVIDFSQKDTFWQANILSTKKLREKFDTLLIQSQTTAKKSHKATGRDKSKEAIMAFASSEGGSIL